MNISICQFAWNSVTFSCQLLKLTSTTRVGLVFFLKSLHWYNRVSFDLQHLMIPQDHGDDPCPVVHVLGGPELLRVVSFVNVTPILQPAFSSYC